MSKFRFDQYNMDAAMSAFFSRELESIRPQVFDKQYPELKARRLLPINNDIHPGAEVYSYNVMDMVGKAKVSRTLGKEAPRAEVHGSNYNQVLASLSSSYAWNLQEARNSEMARKGLDMRKAMAARDSIEQEIEEILLEGHSGLGLVGLFNASGTASYTVPNGAAGSKLWSLKTADEILADLNGMRIQMAEDTKDLEVPNTLVLPIDRLALIKSKRIGDGSSETILAHFLANNPEITMVESSHRLADLGSGSTRRAVMYRRDPMKVEGLIPQEFEQLPPQFTGFEVETYCHARCGGVALYLPKSVMYGDGI